MYQLVKIASNLEVLGERTHRGVRGLAEINLKTSYRTLRQVSTEVEHVVVRGSKSGEMVKKTINLKNNFSLCPGLLRKTCLIISRTLRTYPMHEDMDIGNARWV
nr:hypothetical protein Itr_chr01CG11130 [Ipomoea trifida]